MNNPRQLTENSIVIASHNRGKIEEITAMISPYGIRCESAHSLQLVEPEETGHTYLENAVQKARAANNATGLCALGDDSGIEVDALMGEPGLHTAPYTHAHGGREAIFKLWADNPAIRENPRAHFICILVLYWPDGHYEYVEGRVSGRLSFPPRGTGGHGYDPIFIPDGHDKTIAEMTMAEKNTCSHRFSALNRLLATCCSSRVRSA